jgi:hypothetical protein
MIERYFRQRNPYDTTTGIGLKHGDGLVLQNKKLILSFPEFWEEGIPRAICHYIPCLPKLTSTCSLLAKPMNSELEEVVMVGGPENDYPNGDFVCLCYGCGVDFHGPPVTLCHRCQNQVELVVFTVRPFLIISCVAIAIFLGVLFL